MQNEMYLSEPKLPNKAYTGNLFPASGRRLYGRPLETLLLTWGASLIIQQGLRLWFGAANVDVR